MVCAHRGAEVEQDPGQIGSAPCSYAWSTGPSNNRDGRFASNFWSRIIPFSCGDLSSNPHSSYLGLCHSTFSENMQSKVQNTTTFGMSSSRKLPDVWDDEDWEVQADRLAKEPPEPDPEPRRLTRAELMAKHAEENRRIWEEA